MVMMNKLPIQGNNGQAISSRGNVHEQIATSYLINKYNMMDRNVIASSLSVVDIERDKNLNGLQKKAITEYVLNKCADDAGMVKGPDRVLDRLRVKYGSKGIDKPTIARWCRIAQSRQTIAQPKQLPAVLKPAALPPALANNISLEEQVRNQVLGKGYQYHLDSDAISNKKLATGRISRFHDEDSDELFQDLLEEYHASDFDEASQEIFQQAKSWAINNNGKYKYKDNDCYDAAMKISGRDPNDPGAFVKKPFTRRFLENNLWDMPAGTTVCTERSSMFGPKKIWDAAEKKFRLKFSDHWGVLAHKRNGEPVVIHFGQKVWVSTLPKFLRKVDDNKSVRVYLDGHQKRNLLLAYNSGEPNKS
ncbi:MAG: hypothetical protein WC838_03900 [Candidatus Margulisiibacteriota bacterium]|jgi:hypothetical protein